MCVYIQHTQVQCSMSMNQSKGWEYSRLYKIIAMFSRYQTIQLSNPGDPSATDADVQFCGSQHRVACRIFAISDSFPVNVFNECT